MMRSLFLFCLVVAPLAFGQQQTVYTNFLLNDYYYNPAIAGSKDATVSIAYRNQWTGFNGAPSSLMGNVHGSLKNLGKHGYGVSIISDRTGLTQKTGFYLNYAHHFKLTENVKLGLGIQPGFMQYSVKLFDANLADAGDQVLTGNILSVNAIDMNAGFNLYGPKFFLMGSMSHLLGESIRFTSYNSSLTYHYNLIGGYTVGFPARKLELQPSIMLKYARPVPMQWTAMAKLTYDKKYWAGLIFRSDDALGVSLGMTIKEKLNIGYGYDYPVIGLRKYQSGSHEIMISYILKRKKSDLDTKDEELNKSIMEDMKKQVKEKK
jgi:type IX secretion system PorP/SprF family membrane protein